jgi:AcrR family transcriptional regulator
MPKAFDESEREAIRTAMMTAGLKHFERAGLRAARVDDICRDVGIAKGSFYAFFASKEDLFMAIVEAREEQHRQDMFAFIDTEDGPAARQAARFFDLILRKIETDPILNLVVASNEIQYLTRKLGPERFAKSQADDRAFAKQAARRWKAASGIAIDATDLLDLMAICLAVAVQRQQMVAAQYKSATALLRELFVLRLVGAGK